MRLKTGFSVRTRILFSYFLITALLIITGLIGIFYVGRVYDNGKDIYENDLKAVECLKSISQNLKEIDKCTIHLIEGMDWEHDDSCSDRINHLINNNIELMEIYSMLDVSEQEMELYEQGKASVLEYHKHIQKLISMKQLNNEKDALELYQDKMNSITDHTNRLIESAVDMALRNAEEEHLDNYNIYNRIIWIICSFMLVAVVISIVISYRMSNRIMMKLKSIQLMAKRMSEYNISDDIEIIGHDEFAKTVEALNESQFMVRDLVEKIIRESAIISDMGEEVSLAVRKSEQRIEKVNVNILEYEKTVTEIEEQMQQLINDYSLHNDDEDAIISLNENFKNAKMIRDEARTELSNIVTYLEQIAVTSDYQNEIANNHKEQVKKFKIKDTIE